MWTLGTPALELVIRTALIYVAFFERPPAVRQTRDRPIHALRPRPGSACRERPAACGHGARCVDPRRVDRDPHAVRPQSRRCCPARAQSARPPAPRILADRGWTERRLAPAAAGPPGPGPRRRRGRPPRARTRRGEADEARDPRSRRVDQHRGDGWRRICPSQAPTDPFSSADLTAACPACDGPALACAQRRRRRTGPRVNQSTATPTTQAINRRIQ